CEHSHATRTKPQHHSRFCGELSCVDPERFWAAHIHHFVAGSFDRPLRTCRTRGSLPGGSHPASAQTVSRRNLWANPGDAPRLSRNGFKELFGRNGRLTWGYGVPLAPHGGLPRIDAGRLARLP